MRFSWIALGPIAVLLVACAEQVDVTAGGSGSAAGSGSGSTGGAVSEQVLGQLLVTTEAFQGQLLETFTADLQPIPTKTTIACPGAVATAGACCVFPPIPPVPSPVPGSGTGTANIGTSAGALALLDTTSSSSIGSFDFNSKGYEGLPASYYTTRWQPGDTLNVSAAGDQIGAFTISAPALSPPIMQFPSSILAGQDLKITWQPDPNAETLAIQLLDDDAGSVEIVCSAPDSDGAVTVDASLFAAFKPGDSFAASADRETVRFAQTPTGRVAFKSFGYSASVGVSVK